MEEFKINPVEEIHKYMLKLRGSNIPLVMVITDDDCAICQYGESETVDELGRNVSEWLFDGAYNLEDLNFIKKGNYTDYIIFTSRREVKNLRLIPISYTEAEKILTYHEHRRSKP